MRILGVDPGYAIVGFGVLEYTGTTFTPITYGAITTAAETPFLRRLESISEYTPLQVKQAVVGYGRAEKKQVMELTRRILKLQKIPKPDDAADALAIAICHGHCATGLRGRMES